MIDPDPDNVYRKEISPLEMRLGETYKIVNKYSDLAIILKVNEVYGNEEDFTVIGESLSGKNKNYLARLEFKKGNVRHRVYQRIPPSSSSTQSSSTQSSSTQSSSSGLVKTVMATMIVGVTSLVGIAIYRARTGV